MVLILARLARDRGVAGVFLTGRPEGWRTATEGNLRRAGYEWTGLILKPDHLTTRSAVNFKAPERKKLVDQGYAIIVNIGDQMSDLDGVRRTHVQAAQPVLLHPMRRGVRRTGFGASA